MQEGNSIQHSQTDKNKYETNNLIFRKTKHFTWMDSCTSVTIGMS